MNRAAGICSKRVTNHLDMPLIVTVDRQSAWEAVRIKEMALIQSAHRLAKGEMWLPTQVNAT